MPTKKPSRTFPYVLKLIKALFPHYTVEGALPAGPCLIIGNHAHVHGPLVSQLYMPKDCYTWCAAEVMHAKEVPLYAQKDFWGDKPRSMRWFYVPLSYLIAPLSAYLFTNARTIEVRHDHRSVSAMRSTLQHLQQGRRVIIFPEKAEANNHILCQFQKGFVDVARMYRIRTGKSLPFVPMYTAPSLQKVVLGEPIYFNEETDVDTARAQVCYQLTESITQLALSLPPHRVTPYKNMPAKDYPISK